MDKNLELIVKIVERAEKEELMMFDRVSLLMDLKLAQKEFNLRLEDFLNADEFNFAHDIVGIQKNINREEKKFENHFLPRFSGK